MIWVDDPGRPAAAVARVAAGAARVREPGHGGAGLGHALRGDAVPGRARPADAAVQPARFHAPAGDRDRPVGPLPPTVRTGHVRPGRVQGAERPPRPPGRRPRARALGQAADARPCARPMPRSGSAGTSSPCCCPRRSEAGGAGGDRPDQHRPGRTTTTPASRTLRASFGVAVYPRDGDDPETLFRAADEAMYAAKRSRRAHALRGLTGAAAATSPGWEWIRGAIPARVRGAHPRPTELAWTPSTCQPLRDCAACWR